MLCKVLEYKKFTIITLSNAGKAGIGRGGSKKFKLIPKLPRGAGLEFIPIPPYHLCGARNTQAGRSGEGRVKRGGA